MFYVSPREWTDMYNNNKSVLKNPNVESWVRNVITNIQRSRQKYANDYLPKCEIKTQLDGIHEQQSSGGLVIEFRFTHSSYKCVLWNLARAL